MLKKLSFILCLSLFVYANDYDKSQNIKTKSLSSSYNSQQEINALDSNTKELYDEYKKYISMSETQKRYNKQLDDLIDSQNDEIDILQSDIKKIEHTHKNIVPLMQKMITNLEEFIKLDIPFLIKERQKRVEKLKRNIKRADISVSDKYRQILEAYIVESEYAKSIESYKSSVDGRVVEMLRIGRVGLYYQSLDFKNSGVWDKKKRKFVELDEVYNKKILNAIKISKKHLTPDLLILPMIKEVK